MSKTLSPREKTQHKTIADIRRYQSEILEAEAPIEETIKFKVRFSTINEVKSLMQDPEYRNIDINYQDIADNTFLMYSALKGDYDTAAYLIQKGADVNIKGTAGNTPLMCALQHNFLKIASLLIEKGAKINIINELSETPLNIAVKNGYTKPVGDSNKSIIQLLIDKGADLNLQDKQGYPLTNAILQVHPDAALLLINNGADVSSYFKLHDSTPLLLAASRGQLDVTKALVQKGANIHYKDSKKSGAVEHAMNNKQYDCAKYLLGCGASINHNKIVLNHTSEILWKTSDLADKIVSNTEIKKVDFVIEEDLFVTRLDHGFKLQHLDNIEDSKPIILKFISKFSKSLSQNLQNTLKDMVTHYTSKNQIVEYEEEVVDLKLPENCKPSYKEDTSDDNMKSISPRLTVEGHNSVQALMHKSPAFAKKIHAVFHQEDDSLLSDQDLENILGFNPYNQCSVQVKISGELEHSANN